MITFFTILKSIIIVGAFLCAGYIVGHTKGRLAGIDYWRTRAYKLKDETKHLFEQVQMWKNRAEAAERERDEAYYHARHYRNALHIAVHYKLKEHRNHEPAPEEIERSVNTYLSEGGYDRNKFEPKVRATREATKNECKYKPGQRCPAK